MNLGTHQFEVLQAAVEQGLNDSARALSCMTTGRITLKGPHLAFLPLSEIPGIAGGPAEVVVAVYVAVGGQIDGHLMILLGQTAALRVVDMLMEAPAGTTTQMDDLSLSALAELGNVCGSAFLNALADRTHLRMTPSTPAVVTDMAGAILESVVTELYLNGDEAVVVETGFNGEIPGYFLLMPDQDSMSRLLASLT